MQNFFVLYRVVNANVRQGIMNQTTKLNVLSAQNLFLIVKYAKMQMNAKNALII